MTACCAACTPPAGRYTAPTVSSTNLQFLAAVNSSHTGCLTWLANQELALVARLCAASDVAQPPAADAFHSQQAHALIRMIQLNAVELAEIFLRVCDNRYRWSVIPPKHKHLVMAELAVRGSTDMARLLFRNVNSFRSLNQFSPLTPCTSSGAVVLHIAAFHGRLEMLEIAVHAEQVHCRNPNLLKRTNRGYSALHFAVRGRQLEAVKFLHRSGIPVDDESFSKETPLHVAIRIGCLPVVQYLLEEAGADPTKVLQKRGGRSIIDIAGKAGNSAVMSFLVLKTVVDYDEVQHLRCALWIGLVLGLQLGVGFDSSKPSTYRKKNQLFERRRVTPKWLLFTVLTQFGRKA